MNNTLAKKEKLFSTQEASLTTPGQDNNIFLEPLSKKEAAILKFKHFFFSRKAKINNIINGIDKVLTDPSHWYNGGPITPIAKLIVHERQDRHFSTLRLDEAFGIPGTSDDIALLKAIHDICNFPNMLRININSYPPYFQDRFIRAFTKPLWQSVAPELPAGITPTGTNVKFQETKSAREILFTLDIIRKIKQIQPNYLDNIKDQAFRQYCQLDNQKEDSINATDGFLVYKTYKNPDLIQKYLPSISSVARQKILDHTAKVPVIKKIREQMTTHEMDNYSNLIANNNKLLTVKELKQYMLSNRQGR